MVKFLEIDNQPSPALSRLATLFWDMETSVRTRRRTNSRVKTFCATTATPTLTERDRFPAKQWLCIFLKLQRGLENGMVDDLSGTKWANTTIYGHQAFQWRTSMEKGSSANSNTPAVPIDNEISAFYGTSFSSKFLFLVSAMLTWSEMLYILCEKSHVTQAQSEVS